MKNDNVKNFCLGIGIFILMYLLFFCSAVFGQTKIKRQGNTFIEQADTTKTKMKGQVYETDMLYVEKDGTAYPIFLSSNGNAFINKVSKKSGRKYRKYLPKVTKEIQNERK